MSDLPKGDDSAAIDLAGLLPAGVHGVLRPAKPPDAGWERRFPAEAAAVRDATASRRDEFATGRACARAALGTAGAPDVEVPRDEAGLPRWPDGFVGSISHSRGLCLAVVARRSEISVLGVDIERLGRMRPATANRVLHPGERPFAGDDMDRVTLLFSLKEALYKAVFPETRVLANFGDVRIDVDLERSGARPGWLDPKRFNGAAELQESLRLRFAVDAVIVIAVAWQEA